MDGVTIISQEAIRIPIQWPAHVVGTVGILFVLGTVVILCINPPRMLDIVINLTYHAVGCLVLMLVTLAVCSIFFPQETGRCKYEGTLDPNMTIVEFEEFQQQYSNVRFEDGVWKWEDKNE